MSFRSRTGMAAVFLGLASVGFGAESPDIRFNRDVRPILADKCFACHGPDEAGRKGDLRLDLREAAIAARDGHLPAISPGKSTESEVIHRITTDDLDDRMPPIDSGKSLSPAEAEIVNQWIMQGATWVDHWAFLPPTRHEFPDHEHPVDHFVRQRLRRENLEHSPPANREMLLRRITLDLTGLPPTLDELDAFLKAESPDAWSQVIDRLLRSPRYGEHMAVYWLDAARYADTHGYFGDKERTMWPWRDWVIDAYNRNLPFDRFTIEQMAGDLLPNATVAQKIATGFHRNHTINNESGIIEEEFRVEYVADRVKTTTSVWLGLTLECARCHDHKFDPISQRDYFRFFAFFNSVPERGLDGSRGNAAPLLQIPPTEAEQQALTALRQSLAEAEARFQSLLPDIAKAQETWESDSRERPIFHSLVAENTFDDDPTGYTPRSNPVESAGLIGKGLELKGGAHLEISDESIVIERDKPFSISLWALPKNAGTLISKIDDARDLRGFDLQLRKGKAVVQLAHQWNSDAIQIATVATVPSGQWQHFLVTWDGSGTAAGLRLFLDGKRQAMTVNQDHLVGSIHTPEPIRIGRRQTSAALDGVIDEFQYFNKALNDQEVFSLYETQLLRGLAATPIERRKSPEAAKLQGLFLSTHASREHRDAWERLSQLKEQTKQTSANQIDVMVMADLPNPRETHLMLRGQYDQPGDLVDAGVPQIFPALPKDSNANRLDLAHWLVSADNPLTARVIVNRLWQQFFGRGLVATSDDFGVQGEWPTHPELLDWLAVDFVENGWDLHHLIRQIVTSETYRQSSDATPERIRRDPENRLLARAPRLRLSAEEIRDHALAASGLLVHQLGGPSVKPWQPPGLWKAVTYDGELEYVPDSGKSLYRRSLYTFWKRQSPPPNLLAFDAPARETCVIHRSRTNTPLQALVLMNDPIFIEAARHLAGRLMKESTQLPTDRIAHAFRLTTARHPSADEIEVMLGIYHQQVAYYESHPEEAAALLSVGESPRDESLDPIEHAAWTCIGNLMLCLDETLTKP
ncbi:MAG: DUF1553 domain-containing protein [Verrucomicrobiae bacterium]|nr:DUF1553 domain-containing protein [Verrucomicrobiae bacterium]